mmetsp:Transcript_14824/g.62559  ORF Transcript_14824/g.62559 Transcript_14824/m.62559 type:complete len:216 (+) Transcript_14824:1022-1669(+)
MRGARAPVGLARGRRRDGVRRGEPPVGGLVSAVEGAPGRASPGAQRVGHRHGHRGGKNRTSPAQVPRRRDRGDAFDTSNNRRKQKNASRRRRPDRRRRRVGCVAAPVARAQRHDESVLRPAPDGQRDGPSQARGVRARRGRGRAPRPPEMERVRRDGDKNGNNGARRKRRSRAVRRARQKTQTKRRREDERSRRRRRRNRNRKRKRRLFIRHGKN